MSSLEWQVLMWGNWDEHNEMSRQSNRNTGWVSRWALLLHCSTISLPGMRETENRKQTRGSNRTRGSQLIHNPYEPLRHNSACMWATDEWKMASSRCEIWFYFRCCFLSINSLSLDAELQWKCVFAVLLKGVTSKSNSFKNSFTSASEIPEALTVAILSAITGKLGMLVVIETDNEMSGGL